MDDIKYYVYALLDPTEDNRIFYIGKGTGERPKGHFFESLKNFAYTEIIGHNTENIFEKLLEDGTKISPNSKIKKIQYLQKNDYQAKDIVRIIARNLDDKLAKTIESFLIKNVYQNLTNLVQGKHSERFLGINEKEKLLPLDTYYVYILQNPITNNVFYVGKGKNLRISKHFKDAKNPKETSNLKLESIRYLLDKGIKESDIGQIIANSLTEAEAFAIESLCLKFVYGINNSTNMVRGQHSGRFRAKDDWELREGFDLPYIIYGKGDRRNRLDQLNLVIGEGLDIPLLKIRENFSEIKWDSPTILDSHELAIEGDFPLKTGGDCRIKVFITKKEIQIELRWRKKQQRIDIKNHFKQLGAYPLRRRDDVFFPDQWMKKGRDGWAKNTEEATKRLKIMQKIMSTSDFTALEPHIQELLPCNKNLETQ